jgi:hypothetical protein
VNAVDVILPSLDSITAAAQDQRAGMPDPEISRATPSCFLFVLDQSGSMDEGFGGATATRSKSQELADVINRLLQTLVTRCAKGEAVRDYFDVGVLGYGDTVGSVLRPPLAGRYFVRISELAFHPAVLERRVQAVPDGAGGVVEQPYYFPVWIDPAHLGDTPMCAALRHARTALEQWIGDHPDSYPPTVVHVTDGESTDGDPTEMAAGIRALRTRAGHVSLFNLHLSSTVSRPLTFPSSEAELPDQFARLLFAMSSPLPDSIRREAAAEGYPVTPASRGFAFNADLGETIRFVDIGTRVATIR